MTNLGFQPRRHRVVYCAVIMILAFLAGCQSLSKQHDGHCSQLSRINSDNFELFGKLALSDGQEGGSGRLSWRQHNTQVTAQFKAPLGQGDWLIEESDHGARLVINNEAPYYADHAETLIEEAVGWPVPWHELKRWIVAQPVNRNQAEITRNQTSKTIVEQGWTIVYDRFQDDEQGCFPHRIMASKSPYSIRLIVRQWQR